MINKLTLFIGARYGVSRRHSQLVSFISSLSTAGLVIGVGLLVLVLSIMNGFDRELRERSRAARAFPHAETRRKAPRRAGLSPQDQASPDRAIAAVHWKIGTWLLHCAGKAVISRLYGLPMAGSLEERGISDKLTDGAPGPRRGESKAVMFAGRFRCGRVLRGRGVRRCFLGRVAPPPLAHARSGCCRGGFSLGLKRR